MKQNINNVQDKEVSEKIKQNNQKDSNFKKVVLYGIPLVTTIAIGIIYIPTSNHILLIPFGILLLITLFGWDSNSRTCPRCKKWNSILWIKNDNIIDKSSVKTKSFFGKEKTKFDKRYITKSTGKCKECGYTYTKEKTRKI